MQWESCWSDPPGPQGDPVLGTSDRLNLPHSALQRDILSNPDVDNQ